MNNMNILLSWMRVIIPVNKKIITLVLESGDSLDY